MTGAHIYGAARYLVSTGTQDEDDLEIDHPDTFSLLAGAMLPIGETTHLDLRLNVNHVGDEVAEDDFGNESTEEAHLTFNVETRFYFTVGSTATLILGAHGAGCRIMRSTRSRRPTWSRPSCTALRSAST